MEVLLFKAALAACLVLLASVVSSKAGPRFGGRVLGLPLTTAPFLILLCVESGPEVAAQAAHGAALGQVTVVSFCVAYAISATRTRASFALTIAVLCGVTAEALMVFTHSLWLSVIVVLAAALYRSARRDSFRETRRGSRWELPFRMAVPAVVVAVLTAVAPLTGPVLAGSLSALPVLLGVMAPSEHRTAGGEAAAALLTGALTSAAGTTAMLVVLSVTLVPAGPWVAFATAVGAMAAADTIVRAGRRLVAIRPLGTVTGRSGPTSQSTSESVRNPRPRVRP